jgi:hypothetical protein
MRRNLQSKFNLLAVVLIGFFLLMLPMFTQVRADTRESTHHWKSTWMAQYGNKIAKNLNSKNLENTQVEDYWEKQAREQDPNCGAACDPNADRDGDGVSNRDEARNSKDPNCKTHCNPSCNEDKMGADYCKGIDPAAPIKEPQKNVTATLRRIQLLNYTWTLPTCTGGQPVAGYSPCPPKTFRASGNLSRLEMYLNVTNFVGTQYQLTVNGPGGRPAWSDPRGGQPSAGATYSENHMVDMPPAGDYTANLQLTGVRDGKWDLQVWALVAS